MSAVHERPLDLRDFQDIVDEARRLIPKYCPDWTDHNVSDPGITLIELFAWMTEMILYQLNRTPDEMYERFLDLIGVQRYPPQPAIAPITMYLSSPRLQAVVVPAQTEVATARTERQEAIVFATTAPLTIDPPDLIALRASRQGQASEDYWPYVTSGLVEKGIFNEEPREDDALYIGFGGNLWGYSLQLRVECKALEGAHIDPRDPPLEWEYWSGVNRGWARATLLDQSGTGRRREPRAMDPTLGLNSDGDVYVHIPLDSAPRVVDGVEATWLRIRYMPKRDQGYTSSPRIGGLRCETIGATVPARQSQFIEHEFLGSSSGTPDQRFFLHAPPVLRRETPHVIEAKHGDDVVEWTEVEDFAHSEPTDRHFVLNYRSGEVRFGPEIRSRDASARAYGTVPRKGALLRLLSYYSGGGAIGNVGEGAISELKTSIPFISAVMNYRPASGGLNEESLDEAQLRSLSVLKRSATAVTREDFERIAETVEGVGRAHCITPEEDGSLAAGSLRLVLVPQLPPPDRALTAEDLQPSPFLIRGVSAFLDERKTIGTLIEYAACDITWIEVNAHVYLKRGTDAQAAREAAERKIREYLDPVRGRPAGGRWSFGGTVGELQIAGLLQTVPDVAYVARVTLRLQGERTEASRVQAPPHGLLAVSSIYVDMEVLHEDV
jgi:predicted phage baseplate assembly protein